MSNNNLKKEINLTLENISKILDKLEERANSDQAKIIEKITEIDNYSTDLENDYIREKIDENAKIFQEKAANELKKMTSKFSKEMKFASSAYVESLLNLKKINKKKEKFAVSMNKQSIKQQEKMGIEKLVEVEKKEMLEATREITLELEGI